MRIGFDGKKAVRNFTGIGNYSRRCLRALSEGFADDELLLFIPRHTMGRVEELSRVRLTPVEPSPLLGKGLPYELWRNRLACRDARRLRLDIFHGLSNELPVGIRRAGCKAVVTIHDLIFLRHPETYGRLQRRILTWKTRYAARTADRIIAISEYTKKDLVELYGVAPERISVVYQSIDSVYMQRLDAAELDAVRRKYTLPERYVLCVGSVEQRKNQAVIVKALKALGDDNTELVIVGKRTPYQQQVETLAGDLQLTPRVHILNKVPTADLPAIYQQAALFCFMSFYEGFGIPVAEALASGIPVIAATGSCLEEAGGPGSLYVAPHDDRALAEQMHRVLSDDALRHAMIEEGNEYVRNFTDERMATRLHEVYESL